MQYECNNNETLPASCRIVYWSSELETAIQFVLPPKRMETLKMATTVGAIIKFYKVTGVPVLCMVAKI